MNYITYTCNNIYLRHVNSSSVNVIELINKNRVIYSESQQIRRGSSSNARRIATIQTSLHEASCKYLQRTPTMSFRFISLELEKYTRIK